MTKSAFLFPGESSQSVGVMSAMADHFSLVGKTFEEASEVLGYDLWAVTNSGPESELIVPGGIWREQIY